MPESISSELKLRLLGELRSKGAKVDIFLTAKGSFDGDCFGVNIACAWPLSQALKSSYESLYAKLSRHSFLYVYPFAQTHITILTVMNFKKRKRGVSGLSPNEVGILERVSSVVRKKSIGLREFQIQIRPPVLTREVIFLPIFNPTGEILRLRQSIKVELAESEPGIFDLETPPAIHSTIARFTAGPPRLDEFIDEFSDISGSFPGGNSPVDGILVTLEPFPYMHNGILFREYLLEPAGGP